jgi:hypothetical protein
MLSKDRVPVIFHDFDIGVRAAAAANGDAGGELGIVAAQTAIPTDSTEDVCHTLSYSCCAYSYVCLYVYVWYYSIGIRINPSSALFSIAYIRSQRCSQTSTITTTSQCNSSISGTRDTIGTYSIR